MEFKHLQEVLQRYGEAFRNKLQENLLKDGSNASGALTNSIRYIYEGKGGTFSVSIGLEDYWKYVNDGTKPHFPPVSAIRKWVEIKPVIPEADANGRVPTVAQLAFLIARKISREGTEGTHFFDKTQEEINDYFLLSIEKAVSEDLDEEVDSVLIQLN